MIDMPKILNEDLDVVSEELAKQSESTDNSDMADIVRQVLNNRRNITFLKRYREEVKKARLAFLLPVDYMIAYLVKNNAELQQSPSIP